LIKVRAFKIENLVLWHISPDISRKWGKAAHGCGWDGLYALDFENVIFGQF
jgi:hypothetical protein